MVRRFSRNGAPFSNISSEEDESRGTERILEDSKNRQNIKEHIKPLRRNKAGKQSTDDVAENGGRNE